VKDASPEFEQVLEGYRQRMEEEQTLISSLPPDQEHARRDQLLLPVGEDVAELCVDLVVARGAQVIVELGSSYGFSTLYLAEAARRTGGMLYSYEIRPEKQAHARERIAEAGLSLHVQWRLGDAVALLAEQRGPIDFVLLDLWKDLYIPCLEAFYPNLAPNGIVVADNMLYPRILRADAAAYRKAVRAKPDIEAVLLPVGQGIDLACRSHRPG
jgi:predicted O-methyltransferase YrrM